MCNPFTELDSASTGCACKFNYIVGLSQEIDVDLNQISIETYNLQFNFDGLASDSNDNRDQCKNLFNYVYRSGISNGGRLRTEVSEISCSISD